MKHLISQMIIIKIEAATRANAVSVNVTAVMAAVLAAEEIITVVVVVIVVIMFLVVAMVVIWLVVVVLVMIVALTLSLHNNIDYVVHCIPLLYSHHMAVSDERNPLGAR